ncbi:MotA/TolQ/ExbB proton channel family protein [Hoeflea sp.]|uniref:MotA/TolQ/ExbB proton channel family protein n=1 Tax=Hoeflea sp. TaxID=1940281 RepID=UPI003748A7CF
MNQSKNRRFFCIDTVIALLVTEFERRLDEIGTKNNYLLAVLDRTFASPFQLALAIGWLALVPHARHWLTLRVSRPELDAYSRFAGWAQPLFTALGIIGTIIGVSIAVSGPGQAMKNNEPDILIAGLSVAFDTTFIGLGAALTLMLLRQISEVRLVEVHTGNDTHNGVFPSPKDTGDLKKEAQNVDEISIDNQSKDVSSQP